MTKEWIGDSLSLEKEEIEKYTDYWGRKDRNNPASEGRYVDVAYDLLGMCPGETMIDFGCGSGLCAGMFEEKGVRVTLLDITDSGLADVMRDHAFVRATIWDLPDDLGMADWAYCADVMEHLPPEKVETAIDQITAHARQGAWFKVATCVETRNLKEGVRYHLTVKPHGWWLKVFEDRFRHVEERLCYKPCNKVHPWGLPNYDGLEFAEGAVFICKT